MRRFNPEKELKKIENGNRNKILYSIIALLLIVAVGSTYALYQVRHTKSLVYTTVGDFKKRDIYLSVLVDGKTQGDFPKNNEGKIYSGIECDKEYSEAYFDNTEWKLHFTSDGPNKCTVKFETGNLPNAPELFQGMIPIVYGDNGLMYVADTSKDWYNYQDHRWANAVLVDASNTTIKNKYFKEDNTLRDDIAGNQVLMEEVLQMYVWIPRYKYQLFNIEGSYDVKEHVINVAFEEGMSSTGDIKCSYENKNNGEIKEKCLDQEGNLADNGDWYTHPAFTFGETELTGIWVGKFEPSGEYDNSTKKITNLKILPNLNPLTKSINFAYMFKGVRDIDELYFSQYNLNKDKIDTHVAKNIEWGAISYLVLSVYGRYTSDGNEINNGATVWSNNALSYITGCSSSYVDEKPVENCEEQNKWNHNGIHASTTDNIYGIYDMSGGSYEFVMGNMVNEKGEFNPSGAQFSDVLDETYVQNPKSKYYDIYSYGTTSSANARKHLGDGTEEVVSWFSHNDGFVTSSDTWMARGAPAEYSPRAGFLSFFHRPGGWGSTTFRIVLTAQDGNE